MSFERILGNLNAHYFFREFVFSKNTFRPQPRQELELADTILWLDDILVVFQLKSRQGSDQTTVADERRWFDRKVVKAGTRQTRDTLIYLQEFGMIELENHRGHRFILDRQRVATLQKVVCYSPSSKLPPDRVQKKYHRSNTAGVIHLISASEYGRILQMLLTPAEFSEYLSFREEVIDKWPRHVDLVPESAIVGQYLSGDASSPPDIRFLAYIGALDHRADEWDMSGIVSRFPDRVTSNNETRDYYAIVTELAKLKRAELREFRRRFELSMEKVRSKEVVLPYRFASPRTGCGFVFVPLDPGLLLQRRQGLQNLTSACKYDLKLDRCMGVSFAPGEDSDFSIDWCFMHFDWAYDAELDEGLKACSPFRPVTSTEVSRYEFKDRDASH